MRDTTDYLIFLYNTTITGWGLLLSDCNQIPEVEGKIENTPSQNRRHGGFPKLRVLFFFWGGCGSSNKDSIFLVI